MSTRSEQTLDPRFTDPAQPRGFPGLPPGWRTDRETFRTADDEIDLFCATHRRQDVRGHRALVVLHGLGEHGGRYMHVPHYVQSDIDWVSCPDQRGHGRSGGLRGDAARFDILADDFASVIRRTDRIVKEACGGRSEIHVLAHSLGGHVALRALFRHPELARVPVQSVSLSAPFLAIKQRVPWIRKAAARSISRIWGTLQMGTGLDASLISHDPEVVNSYRSDPLVHDRITPRFFTSMIAAFEDTLGRNGGFDIPTQFLVPMDDRIVDSQVTANFFERLQTPAKRLATYEGFYHEILNEIERVRPFQDVVAWIHSRHGHD